MLKQKINTSIKILIYLFTVVYTDTGPTIIKQTYRFNTLPDDGSYSLILSNISGDLIVSGNEGSGAFINVEKITFGIKKEDIPNIHKKDNIIVTHLEEQNLINITGDSSSSNTNFMQTSIELSLPKHINLSFNINGGDISIKMIIGEINLSTLGGDIVIKDSEGEINSHTNGGTIDIENSKGNAQINSFGGGIKIQNFQGSIASSTIGGDITLTYISGDINCQSSGGSITLKNIEGNIISCRASGGEIIGEDLNGEITLKCFGGDTNIKNISGIGNLYSSGGNFSIKNFTGALVVNTEKGNILIDDAVGGIEAITSAGDIDVNLSYDSQIKDYSIYMETHMGNIKTYVPKNLPANMENIVYQTTSMQSIDSEIILKLEVEHEKIIGRRTIAGGTVPFSLKAHHGTITIKDK